MPSRVVAVVEDDAPVRRAMGRLLRAGGFEPALFESAEAYLDAPPESLCVVIDVQLPGMSGTDLQHQLSSAGTASPIIVITASRQTVHRERAEQNGCLRFFQKPVDSGALLATIMSLADSSPADP
jgi:FixJ family two-component response regulator